MPDFERVFQPIKIGTMQLDNRIIMPAMHLGMEHDGRPSDSFIGFYEERAKAHPGPGLIIVGGLYIEKRGMGAPNFVSISDDKYIPGLKEYTDTIHRHGVKTAAQLFHAGRYAHSFVIGEQPVSSSDVTSRYTGEKPRPLSIDEIKEIIGCYAKAARRAREAGFDAVELICSAGYLVSQFLSPLTNRREDRYGGDINGRMTFLLETIEAIRGFTGNDFPLICRLSGSDFVEGSHTLDETKVIAAAIEKAGVDLINITGGWHETKVPQITMNVPRGAYVYLAEGVKKVVKEVPVACCNRINDPLLAETILAEGRADMVAMGRAFIADPCILEKAKQGRRSEIRKCIACNQGCFDYVFMLKPITCTVNPRVGREKDTVLEQADVLKKILVVGGGPAGCEAAWAAARRGHKVILCEKGSRLGGQCLLAGVPPGREEFLELVTYFENQMGTLNIEVRLNTTVDLDLIHEIGPDAVVLATGAVQIKPYIQGMDDRKILYAWDVLSGEAEAGNTVVIVGGGAVGIETGMLLAEKGKTVTVLEMQPRLGSDIGLSSRWTILQDARSLGVKMLGGRTVVETGRSGVVAKKGDETEEYDADTVIVAVGSKPDDCLGEALEAEKKAGLEVHQVGDCVEARKAIDAIREGFEAGLRI